MGNEIQSHVITHNNEHHKSIRERLNSIRRKSEDNNNITSTRQLALDTQTRQNEELEIIPDNMKTYMLWTSKENNEFYANDVCENPFQEGLQLLDMSDIKAVHAFEAAIMKDQHNSEAWRVLGLLHDDAERRKASISALLQATQANQFNYTAQKDLAISLTNNGFPHLALQACRSWILLNPIFDGMTTGVEYQPGQTKVNKLMTLLIRADAWAPSDPEVLEILSVVYVVQGDADSASSALMGALSKKVTLNKHRLWDRLGVIYTDVSNDQEKALECYDKALDIRPNFVKALHNRSRSLMKMGNKVEAIEYLEKALAINPNSTQVTLSYEQAKEMIVG